MFQLARDRFRFRIRLFDTDTGPEFGHNFIHGHCTIGQWQTVDISLQRHPDFGSRR